MPIITLVRRSRIPHKTGDATPMGSERNDHL
jgi:hypothetical protein